MARQAEAERERRAKIINAEGEFQAAERLYDAAEIISGNPAALQLRYLQTLLEVSSNQSSTIVLPVPTDLIRPLLERGDGTAERPKRPSRERSSEPERLGPTPDGGRDLPAPEPEPFDAAEEAPEAEPIVRPEGTS
jgi:hypothetical protein